MSTLPLMARQVAFDTLPSAVRERLARVLRRRDPLRPLWVRHDPMVVQRGLAFVLVGLAVLGAVQYAMRQGFGEPGTQILDLGSLIVLVAIAGAGGAVVGLGLARLIAQIVQPVRDGIYLLPNDLITADRGALAVIPLATLQSVTGTHYETAKGYQAGQIVLRFTDQRIIELRFSKAAPAEAVAKSLARYREALSTAVATKDADTLVLLDPFLECRVRSWTASDESERSSGTLFARTARLAKRAPLVLGVVFVVLASCAAWARNAASDKRAFEVAVASRDVEKLDSYMAGAPAGSPHAVAVRTRHLPVARLAKLNSLGELIAARSDAAATADVAADRERLIAARYDAIERALEALAATPAAHERARRLAAGIRSRGLGQFALIYKELDESDFNADTARIEALARTKAEEGEESDVVRTVVPTAGFFRGAAHAAKVREAVIQGLRRVFPSGTLDAAGEAKGLRDLDVIIGQRIEVDGLVGIDGKYYQRARIQFTLDLRFDEKEPPVRIELVSAMGEATTKISIRTEGPRRTYRGRDVYEALDDDTLEGFSAGLLRAFAN